MYTISLMRVTGKYINGKWAHTGTISFCKAHSLKEAKNTAADKMKQGYYNYANISGGDDGINIERLYGNEWVAAT